MKKKLIAALLASSMLLPTLAGCGGKGGDPDTLTIVSWGNNSDIKNMIEIFCEATNTPKEKINLVTQGDGGEQGRDQIVTYLQGNGDADIITLEADWILSYINDSKLTAPLSDVGISASDFANPYGYTVEIGKNESGVQVGASFQATPGGFVYRTDLAEKYLGVKTPEEMQALVSDWDKFRSTAATLYDASSADGKGVAITATEGGLWQVYAANRSKPWVVDDKLVMDNAEEFYDIVKDFTDKGYMTTATQWDPSWYAAIKNGDALGDFVSTWGMTEASILGEFNQDGAKGKLAFVEGPSPYFWGGTWLALAAKHDTDDLAAQFIKFFTCEDENMKLYSEKTDDFCNNSKVMQEIVDAGHSNPILVDGQDQFSVFLEQAANLDLTGKLTKYDSVIKGHFNDSVQKYANGTYATKEDAIKAFKEAVVKSFGNIKVDDEAAAE